MIATTQYRVTAGDLEVTLALPRHRDGHGAGRTRRTDGNGTRGSSFVCRVGAVTDLGHGAHHDDRHHPAWPGRTGVAQPARCSPPAEYELHAGNELASLSRRDADIAVRATKPRHSVGSQQHPVRAGTGGSGAGRGHRAAVPGRRSRGCRPVDPASGRVRDAAVVADASRVAPSAPGGHGVFALVPGHEHAVKLRAEAGFGTPRASAPLQRDGLLGGAARQPFDQILGRAELDQRPIN